jgi:hypothetical protein
MGKIRHFGVLALQYSSAATKGTKRKFWPERLERGGP